MIKKEFQPQEMYLEMKKHKANQYSEDLNTRKLFTFHDSIPKIVFLHILS